MPGILQKIVDRIREDHREEFECFDPDMACTTRLCREPEELVSRMKADFFLIAEAKKGSPSRGVLREPFDPGFLASEYERAGASAVSIVTEKNYFYGCISFLEEVRKKVSIPVLRKDFIIHPRQIYQSYDMGADMILLIAACLDDRELESLYATATRLGLNVLFEVHDEQEIERVLDVKPGIVGINNRDLKTFRVDLDTSIRLKRRIPDGIPVISESGIKDHRDLKKLRDYGFSGALVGESILGHQDVFQAVRELLHGKD